MSQSHLYVRETLANEMPELLERASRHEKLNRAEWLDLATCAELLELLRTATAVRRSGKGVTVSYSRKVFVPLTRLCRDNCGYCTFRRDPGSSESGFLTPEEVLAIAHAGRRAGCKEVLFSLGDQPELRFEEAREDLRRLGFQRTLDYLAAMSELVLAEVGLLPHSNPGLMDRQALSRLRSSNASLGLMLESSSRRLMSKGLAHSKAPDKAPPLRLKTIDTAGELRIAFTTGILIGIGETLEERIDSLLAIRNLHEKHGHIQEVIVQNFRAKEGTPMSAAQEPPIAHLLRTTAMARLIFGPDMNLQVPPNLSYEDFPKLLEAGINDWGGISPVTPDFINPEASWPAVQTLRSACGERGLLLRERLAIYAEFISRGIFLSPQVSEKVNQLAQSDGFAAFPAWSE